VSDEDRIETHRRYPLTSVLIYDGVTMLHYLLGGLVLWLAYGPGAPGTVAAFAYVVFAFGQMTCSCRSWCAAAASTRAWRTRAASPASTRSCGASA
jgi:hypothetical protein